MITQDEIARAEAAVLELQESAHPTPDLAGESNAESGAFNLPAPASPSGAEIILPANAILEAAAADNAEIAAQFIRAGRRHLGREHLRRAIEQLNEAEIE